MPNDYVFLDANTLIYFGKSQLIWGNPTLDRLYIPNSQIVITPTVLGEITRANKPDSAISRQWIEDGVAAGRITIFEDRNPATSYTGRGDGEKSIIDTIRSSEWTHPYRAGSSQIT